MVIVFSPATWNSGATASMTSSRMKSVSTSAVKYWKLSVPWVCVAPLGRPVVPEVYMIIAGSSQLTGSSMTSVPPAARNSSNPTAPGARAAARRAPPAGAAPSSTAIHRTPSRWARRAACWACSAP